MYFELIHARAQARVCINFKIKSTLLYMPIHFSTKFYQNLSNGFCVILLHIFLVNTRSRTNVCAYQLQNYIRSSLDMYTPLIKFLLKSLKKFLRNHERNHSEIAVDSQMC